MCAHVCVCVCASVRVCAHACLFRFVRPGQAHRNQTHAEACRTKRVCVPRQRSSSGGERERERGAQTQPRRSVVSASLRHACVRRCRLLSCLFVCAPRVAHRVHHRVALRRVRGKHRPHARRRRAAPTAQEVKRASVTQMTGACVRQPRACVLRWRAPRPRRPARRARAPPRARRGSRRRATARPSWRRCGRATAPPSRAEKTAHKTHG
jgi:hypothetical protein